MSKEGVVFLLDAHPSMNEPYPSTHDENKSDKSSTRLSCAKDALEGMVSQLMIQSKTNEVGVIVFNSDPVVKMEEDGYSDAETPYLRELSNPCVTRPSVDLLRAIRKVECAKTEYSGADVIQAMVAAENRLRHRTFKKKYTRRLVIFTDAAHKFESPNVDLLRLIDKLRELECTLSVIGVDFENSATFEAPLPKDEAAVKSEENDEANENDQDETMSDTDGSNTTTGDDKSEDDDDDESMDSKEEQGDEDESKEIKSQNEKLLISVARLTGGSIAAASTMREITDASLGKRIRKSTKPKILFHIAPGLTLNARRSLLMKKEGFPRLTKEAVVFNQDGNPKVDANGEIMTNPVKTVTAHFDSDDKTEEVVESDRTHGYRYGADYIPMSSVDMSGLRQQGSSEPAVRILGYVDQSSVPRSMLFGEPYAITGHDSHRTCCAIAALALALDRMKKAAICVSFKSRNSDPILGALFPLQEEGQPEPTRLYFLQLPYAEEKRPFNLNPLEPSAKDSAESRACDCLIDAMMLPADTLRSEEIANPALRSFRKTVKARAVDPFFNGIVTVRDETGTDPMATPGEVLEKAASAIETFATTFPREIVTEEEAKGKKKKKYWTDLDG
jgi:hypothetical protein